MVALALTVTELFNKVCEVSTERKKELRRQIKNKTYPPPMGIGNYSSIFGCTMIIYAGADLRIHLGGGGAGLGQEFCEGVQGSQKGKPVGIFKLTSKTINLWGVNPPNPPNPLGPPV